MDSSRRAGDGWRLGYQSTKEYPALVGGDDWALELTAAELADFCRLLYQLANTMQQMQGELMAEEKIVCEAESDRLWLQVSGYAHSYELRLLLQTGLKATGQPPL
jgi:hypothetical protein